MKLCGFVFDVFDVFDVCVCVCVFVRVISRTLLFEAQRRSKEAGFESQLAAPPEV